MVPGLRRIGLVAFGALLGIGAIESAARLTPDGLPTEVLLTLGPGARRQLIRCSPELFASIHTEWQRVFTFDPKVGVRLKVNQRVRIRPSVDHRPYWLVTDSQGFRNPRDDPQADIVAIGDSMTEGVGVPDEATWVRQLEQLNGLPVANLGIRGHNLPLKLATLEVYGLPKRPRIALFQYLDDLGFPDPSGRPTEGSLPAGWMQRMIEVRRKELTEMPLDVPAPISFAHPWEWIRSHSVTYSLLRFVGKELRRQLPWVIAGQKARDAETIARFSGEFHLNGRIVRLATEELPAFLKTTAQRSPEFLRQQPDWPRFQEIFLHLRDRASRQGADLVLLLIPDPLPLYLPLVAKQLPPDEALGAALQNVDADAQVLGSFCAVNGMPFIDTTSALRAAAARGEQLCFPIDPHWDAPGHRAIAQEIYRVLVEKGLLLRSEA